MKKNHSCARAAIFVFLQVWVFASAGRTAEMEPFWIEWEKAEESAIDLSSFLEAPAGKDGFIRVEKDHLVKPDGERFRIWGVNICSAYCFPPKEDAPATAADLARYGINCVRFHHMDTRYGGIFDPNRDDTRHLSTQNLDRLDFFIAELKKRGIYSNLNLNVSRQFKKGDGVRDYAILGYAKGATYFNERIVELQREYARQLLTHHNPYTKSEYRHEPAVAVVEMVNENSMVESWLMYRLVGKDPEDGGSTWSPLPVSYAKELTEQYNAWLAKRFSEEQLERFRELSGVKAGQPVPRLQPHEFAKAPQERFHTEAAFYMELEDRFFRGMRKLLKEELAVKSLLVGDADHNDGISGYPHIRANLLFDLVDGHGYWEHPRLNPFWMRNTPMVNDPFDSTVVQFARTPVLGRPYTISETNHPFPNEYACEGIPTLTAYSLLYDWDGIYWFALGQPRLTTRQKAPLRIFDFGNDPVKMSQVAVCGLMFYRRDVREAQQTVVRAYSPDDAIESLRLPREERPFFTPGFARSTPLEHATRLTFEGKSTLPFPKHNGGPIIRSDTGQLTWYHDPQKKGLVTIETEKTQALIGFVKHRAKSLRNLSADVENDFCAVVCTSLDAKPISTSGQLLLSASARVANSGMTLDEERHAAPQWGTYPPVIEPVTGAIILRGLEAVRSVEVHPLTAEGRMIEAASKVTRVGDQWHIPVGESTTVWYLVKVNRSD